MTISKQKIINDLDSLASLFDSFAKELRQSSEKLSKSITKAEARLSTKSVTNNSELQLLHSNLDKINKCCNTINTSVNYIGIIINTDKVNEIGNLFKPFEYYKKFNEDLLKDEYYKIKNYIIQHKLNIKNIEIDDYLNVNCKDCEDCKLCIDCDCCENCIDCIECELCRNCETCLDCGFCEFCSNKKHGRYKCY